MRFLGIFFTIFLWLLFGWKAYTDTNTCCNAVDEAQISNPIIADNVCPICFRYNDPIPSLCENWETIKNDLIASCDSNDNIIIELYVDDNEDVPIAQTRSLKLKTLISDQFDSDRIIVREVRRNGSNKDKKYCTLRSSIRRSSVESINENVFRIDDKIVFYFPVNSINRIANAKVESYLNAIALDLTSNNKNIILTGHTDDVADSEYNLDLGQQRADIIKDYLISKGVDDVRISTISKGETEPISDNSTDKGRAMNRRTELEVVN